jgi:hypothetical protein
MIGRLLQIAAGAFGLLVLAVGGFLVAYPWLYPTHVVHYRLTVTAVIGDERYIGSNVVEVEVKTQPKLLDSPRWAFRVDGEPVSVDVGSDRYLVA